MKKILVLLAMIFAFALIVQPKAQAGVFVRFGLPIPVPVPVFYGPAYYPGGITMVHMAMPTIRGPTGATGPGSTDVGTTIKSLTKGSPGSLLDGANDHCSEG
jgi:hypothetical protein